MSLSIELADFMADEELLKGFGKDGLVPIRKTITSGNRTYQQTYWTKPKDITAFKATAPALEFLIKSIESQNELTAMVRQLEQYNSTLAAECYNAMIQNGETSIQIADKMVETKDWLDRRETNPTALVAGLRNAINEKGSIKMGELTQVFEDISYQYQNFGLDISTTDAAGKKTSMKKVPILQSLVPVNWTDRVDGIAKTIRQTIKDGLSTLRLLYKKRGRPDVPLMLEEKDLRLKENKGVMDQLEAEYKEKQTSRAGGLSQAQKQATAGVAPKAPNSTPKVAKLVVATKPKLKTFKDLSDEERQDMYVNYRHNGGKLSYINFVAMMKAKEA